MKWLIPLVGICLVPQLLMAAEFTVEKTATGGAVVKIEGQVFTEYVVDQANKPYLWPIVGPTGKLMTRSFPMQDVPGEAHDHVHHRGITFGHEGLGRVNTWLEPASLPDKPENVERRKHLGRIRHREFKELRGGAIAVIHAVADYIGPEGQVVNTDERRMTFRVVGQTRVIDFDIDLIASQGPISVDDKKDAGVSIRVPHSMSVDARQGGTIINSEDQKDADAWGKRAKWCDYHGPVENEHLGIAILNHPHSFRHPTRWHVRTYGLFAANAFGPSSLDESATNGTFELKSGERVKLRHRFILHAGDEKEAKIAELYEAYANEDR